MIDSVQVVIHRQLAKNAFRGSPIIALDGVESLHAAGTRSCSLQLPAAGQTIMHAAGDNECTLTILPVPCGLLLRHGGLRVIFTCA